MRKGQQVSEEVKAKISKTKREQWKNPEYRDAHSGKNAAFFGKTHSEEFKAKRSAEWTGENNPMKRSEIAAKVSASLTGRTFSEETKTKLSAAAIERWKDSEYRAKMSVVMASRVLSEEHKAKISAAGKGRVCSEETRARMSAAQTGRVVSEEECAKHSAWWTPERKAEQREAVAGENNPMYGMAGEKNPNWRGGLSFEPYGVDFNDELKCQIRNRDNHTCQECLRTEEQLYCALDVHHIDYDKTNNSPENLIALCRSCHGKTGINREDWTEYFGIIMEAS